MLWVAGGNPRPPALSDNPVLSLIWHEYNIIQSVPCSLGMLKIINWTMYLLGDCWLMYWPTSRLNVNQYIDQFTQSTLDWHVGRQSVESRPICGRYSVATVYRWLVGRYFADGSSTYHWHLADITADTWVATVGWELAASHPICGRYLTATVYQSIVGQYFANKSSTINPLSA